MKSWLRRLLIRAAAYAAFAAPSFAADYTYAQHLKELRPLKKTLEVYQHRLHLDDAGITVRLVKEVPEGACGYSQFDYESGFGVINVLRADGYEARPECKPHKGTIAEDQRDTVVHELIHLLVNAKSEEHQAVILSHALMRK